MEARNHVGMIVSIATTKDGLQVKRVLVTKQDRIGRGKGSAASSIFSSRRVQANARKAASIWSWAPYTIFNPWS